MGRQRVRSWGWTLPLVLTAWFPSANAHAATAPAAAQNVAPPAKESKPSTGMGTQAAPAASPSALPAAAKPATVEVSGFRSARFGTAEDEVRAAIEKDFGKKADQIRAEENLSEQTRVLSVIMPDLLPGGGTAQVAYVFGYKTKKLIQVAVSWSKATDEAMTPERLFSNANILRAHFLEAGYRPETIATNAVVAGGLVMFRGSDAADRTTLLLLQGTTSEGENNQRILAPSALSLFYLADAKNPDIFRLPPGQF
jgi:hypothetical protein